MDSARACMPACLHACMRLPTKNNATIPPAGSESDPMQSNSEALMLSNVPYERDGSFAIRCWLPPLPLLLSSKNPS